MSGLSVEKLKKMTVELCRQCACPVVCESWNVEEIMLPSHDGVCLRTIIYRPDIGGPLPAVVFRSCYYGLDAVYRARAKEYCRHGLAVVYQYCRGVGGSEGDWEPNVCDRDDGRSFLEWLNSQSWAESIGVHGHSYLAMTGWVIADIVPEKVKTLYLTHYGTFRHVSAYKDGLFRHDVLTSWAMDNAGRRIDADYTESCRFRPQLEVDEKLWGCRLDWYRSWIQSPERNAPYWQTGFWKLMQEIPARVKLPVFIAEGWYDHHLGSAIETYKALSDEAKKHSVFMIGAWTHMFDINSGGYTGDNFDNNDEARALDWFHDILVMGRLPEGCVREYVIGDDRWQSFGSFPEARHELRLYLNADERTGRRSLETDEMKCGGGFCSYTYDPQSPVPSRGGDSMLKTQAWQGSLKQPGPDWRGDVLSFISAPFDEEFTITGKVKAHLKVSSDAEDTAFVVKFMEILPDGRAFNIRTAASTLAFRNGSDVRLSYTPGRAVDICVDSWDVAWKLQRGSRLRIDISSSAFPEYSVHSNYPGPWAEQEKTKKAEQKIYFGKQGSSYISLPYIK